MYALSRDPASGAVVYFRPDAHPTTPPPDGPPPAPAPPPAPVPPRRGVSFDRWRSRNEDVLRDMATAIAADLRALTHTHDGRAVTWRSRPELEEAVVRFAYETSDVTGGGHARLR